MTRNERRISAGAVSLIVGTVALVGYLYRHEIGGFLLSLALLRAAWVVIRHRLGMRPRARGQGWVEVALAGLGGWLFARRSEDAVRQAVRSGSEVQVVVKPRSRYGSR